MTQAVFSLSLSRLAIVCKRHGWQLQVLRRRAGDAPESGLADLFDVNNMGELCEDLSDLQQLTVISLQAVAVRRVLNTASAFGMGKQKTYDEYIAQINLFDQQDPQVPTPFPPYFKQPMHGVGATMAHSAAEFGVVFADNEFGKFVAPLACIEDVH